MIKKVVSSFPKEITFTHADGTAVLTEIKTRGTNGVKLTQEVGLYKYLEGIKKGSLLPLTLENLTYMVNNFVLKSYE